jgi:hypothetical protein
MNLKNLFLFLSVAWLVMACESDLDLSERDPEKLAISEVNKNHEILVDAYTALATAIPAEEITAVRNASGNKAEFVRAMYQKSDEVFKDVLVNRLGEEAVDYYLEIKGIKGAVFEENLEIMLMENSTDVFKSEVNKRLKAKSSSFDTWNIFKQLKFADGRSEPMPTESVAFAFSKIEFAVDLSDVLLDLSLSDAERTKAIGDAIASGQTPPVLAALLLPAVQKVKETAMATEAEEKYLLWMDEEVTPTTSGGLDRDIIRRTVFYEYLGALDLFIGQEYNNEDQFSASVALMKARYDFKLLSLWADYWDLDPAGD